MYYVSQSMSNTMSMRGSRANDTITTNERKSFYDMMIEGTSSSRDKRS